MLSTLLPRLSVAGYVVIGSLGGFPTQEIPLRFGQRIAPVLSKKPNKHLLTLLYRFQTPIRKGIWPRDINVQHPHLIWNT